MMDYLFGSGPAWQGRKLRVRVGSSLSNLETVNVNDDSHPHFIDSPYFTGNVAVRVKNFNGVVPEGVKAPIASSDYFGTRRRLFSIQVQGRFKHEHTTDDVIFGAEFENKVSPPTGAWLAVKFANYIDPALITDMYSDRPWLYSPMLCSMNTVNVVKAPSPVVGAAPLPIKPTDPPLRAGGKEISVPSAKAAAAGVDPEKVLGKWEWGGEVELKEENTMLIPDPSKVKIEDADGTHDGRPFPPDGIAERRKWFNKKDNRLATTFSPDYVYNLEIFAPFIDFNTFDLTLGINVNLLRYLSDQPIRLICKSHSKNVPFYVIEFLLIGDGPLPPMKPGEGEAPAEPPK
ncbi:hypothetical protein HDU96_011028 [Phlyctochytrium bullatum]|nr:hypothetical protein HDU96_011028 [Phlyctochytrium bullatum]